MLSTVHQVTHNIRRGWDDGFEREIERKREGRKGEREKEKNRYRKLLYTELLQSTLSLCAFL